MSLFAGIQTDRSKHALSEIYISTASLHQSLLNYEKNRRICHSGFDFSYIIFN